MKKNIIFTTAAAILFFGVSLSVYHRRVWPGQEALQPVIELGSIVPVMAAGANWDPVRSTATFIRGVIRGIDSIVGALSTNGLLSSATTRSGTYGAFRWQYKVAAGTTNTNEITGSNSYSKSFEICAGSVRVFQMLFDDATSPQTGNGLVVVWQPKAFSPTLTGSGLIKCSLGLSSGAKTMICSWGNGPFDTAVGPDNVRIQVSEDNANGEIAFVGIARLQSSLKFCTNAGWTGNDYYSLAYRAKSTAPYNTIAKFGLANTLNFSTANAVNICIPSSAGNYISNPYNAAQFNATASGYYVADGVSTDTAGYPTLANLGTTVGVLNTGAFTPANIDALTGTPPTFSGSGGPNSACGF